MLSCLLLKSTSTNAFLPQRNQVAFDNVIGFKKTIKQSTDSKLYGNWESYDPSDEHPSYEDALARNKARTDVRNFLTQRAIQSFICLLDHCRDPHTVAWVEVRAFSSIVCFSSLKSYCFNQYWSISPRRVRISQPTHLLTTKSFVSCPHYRMQWIAKTLAAFMVLVHLT